MLVRKTPSFKGEQKYAPSPQYLLLSKPKEPLAVYLPLTIDCVRMKQWAEERGFKTAAILGKNTKNYTVSVSDATVRQQIEENGTIPEWVDVLIFDYSLDSDVAINHGHIKRLYADKSPTIHHLFKYSVEIYNHQNWEEWQEENFPAYMNIPVADKKLWHDAMGFSKWKNWKEELEKCGYDVTTKKSVVTIDKEKKYKATIEVVLPQYIDLAVPQYIDLANNSVCPPTQCIDFENGAIFSKKRILKGLQKNVWYSSPVLKNVFGFATSTRFKEYASAKGCVAISGRITKNGKRIRVFAIVENEKIKPAATFLDRFCEISHPSHLKNIEEIFEFQGKKFDAEKYLTQLLMLSL